MYTLATEPQGIGKVLDAGFKLFFASFKNILGLLGLNIVANLLIMGLFVSSMVSMYSSGRPATTMSGSMMVMFLLLMVINIAAAAGYTGKTFAIANGEGMSLGQAINLGLKKFFPIMIWFILYILCIALGFAALLIPGFLLMISLSFGMYIMVMENVGPLDGLKRSHKLIWGSWWRTSMYITIVYIIALIALLIILIPIGIVVGILAGGNPMVLASLDGINQVLSIIIMPFFIAMVIPYYHDLKLRKEGGDLAARIKAGAAK